MTLGKRAIYSNGDEKLNMPDKLTNLTITDEKSQFNRVFKLKIILQTPHRPKFKNQLRADLPFHVLVRAMLRWISSLLFFYGDGEPHFRLSRICEKSDECGNRKQ